jgi:hypothetical protein
MLYACVQKLMWESEKTRIWRVRLPPGGQRGGGAREFLRRGVPWAGQPPRAAPNRAHACQLLQFHADLPAAHALRTPNGMRSLCLIPDPGRDGPAVEWINDDQRQIYRLS